LFATSVFEPSTSCLIPLVRVGTEFTKESIPSARLLLPATSFFVPSLSGANPDASADVPVASADVPVASVAVPSFWNLAVFSFKLLAPSVNSLT